MLQIKTRIASSAIAGAGLGLFSENYLIKGTIIHKALSGADIQVTLDKLLGFPEAFQEKMYTHGVFDPESGTFLLSADDMAFINHSDHPNCGESVGPHPEEVLVALRDIVPGEELTLDYRSIGASTDFTYRPPSFAEAFIKRARNGYWPTSTRL